MSSSIDNIDASWRVRPQADLRWRCWDGEVVVYHPASGDTHFLNPIASEVLRRLEYQPGAPADLARHLSDTFDLPADDDLIDQVRHCLTQFEELGIIEPIGAAADSPESAHASEGSE